MEGLQLPVEAMQSAGEVRHDEAHLPEVKTEAVNITSEGDEGDSVNLKVLWSGDTSGIVGYQVVTEESLEDESHAKSPGSEDGEGDQEHDISSDLGGQVHVVGGHDLDSAEGHLETGHGGDHGVILAGDDSHPDSGILSDESHMLHVPDTGGSLLTDSSQTIQVATSLATALSQDQDVIQLLSLPNSENEDSNVVTLNSISLTTGSVVTPPTQTVQAITLSNGTTAFIQHANGKFLEGQTITLEDGTTAIVQGHNKLQEIGLNSPTTTTTQGVVVKSESTQSIQLDDGTTGFLNQAVKDSLQAIILEDGTMAYIASQQAPPQVVDASILDKLGTPETQAVQVIPNGIVSMNTTKPIENVEQTEMNNVVTMPQETKDMKQNFNFMQVVQQTTPGTAADKSVAFGEKAYKCNFNDCGRLYTTSHHLKVHERSHTGDRPFKCEFEDCGKAFATGYGLKSHTRVHTGEKPYRCGEDGCDKAFKTSGDLQKHVRTHTGERPFRCPFEGCDRSFTTSNIRKVHIRTHTGERPYCCPEEGCGRAFASATNYKNHIRIHTGEKPYVCTVAGCGKRFTEYSSLYKHHVVHTHSKPYMCNYCHKTYRQTSTLAMHKRTVHGEDTSTEHEAALFEVQNAGLEPAEKRPRISLKMAPDGLEEEGTLVINTSDPNQTLSFMTPETLSVIAGSTDKTSLSTTQADHTALLQQAGVASFTLGEQGQQVYVITDPAQLEALQQIAQQQFEGETLDSSVITALTGVEEDASMEPTDSVNPEIVANTDVESITNAVTIDSSEVIDTENL